MFQFFTIIALLFGEVFTESCKDIYMKRYSNHNNALDGLYDFTPNDADPYLIYCDFETGHGYTYISTTAFQYTDPKDHHFERSEFKIVLLYANGSQYQVPISRPKKSRKIDVAYTFESSYNNWLANDLMYPYITVSMKSKITNRTSFGYLANGTKVSDQICVREHFKQYARLIFGFLFNHNYLHPVQDEKKRKSTEYLKKWVDLATLVPARDRLPRNFFSFFEVKHKDCGGYMTTDDFMDVIGAAVGLKFVIRCGPPPDINHASKRISGNEYNSTVTYECDDGYEFQKNQTVMKCSAIGEWEGVILPCIRKKPRTCFDHEIMNNAKIPGVYIVYDKMNEPYKIYCEFYDNYTLTFMTPFGMASHLFDVHYNDKSVIVVRSYLIDDTQVESVIKQLDTYNEYPIEIRYNKKSYYRNDELSVLINNKSNKKGQLNIGYVVNGVEVTETFNFRNSYDKTTISFKVAYEEPTSRKGSQNFHFFLVEWLAEAIDLQGKLYMPKSFYFSFAISNYASYSNYGSSEQFFPNLYGINIGLRYNKN